MYIRIDLIHTYIFLIRNSIKGLYCVMYNLTKPLKLSHLKLEISNTKYINLENIYHNTKLQKIIKN